MAPIVTLGLDRIPVPARTFQKPQVAAGGAIEKSMSIDEFLGRLRKDPSRPSKLALSQGEMLDNYQDWVYTAVSTIADRMMDLDWYLVRESRGGSSTVTTPVERHIFLDLLDNPNPLMTREELINVTWVHKLLTGNAYWYTDPVGVGNTPTVLLPLVPSEVGLVINRKTMSVMYVWSRDGQVSVLPAGSVVHFRLPSARNIYFGASPIQAFAYAHDISMYSQVYQVRYFANSAVPEYVISYPENVDVDSEQIKMIWAMIKEKHQGVDKAHLPMVLGRGAKAQPLGPGGADARYLSATETTREKIICGAYKVPLAVVGMMADFNRANSQYADIAFNKQCIKPKATLFAGRVNRDVLERYYPQPGQGDRLRLVFGNPIPTDRELEILEREHFIRMGLKSRNQILEEIGEPPVEYGDEILIQGGLVPYDAVSLQALDEAVPAEPVEEPAPVEGEEPTEPEGEAAPGQATGEEPVEEDTGEDNEGGEAKAKPELVATHGVKIAASSDPALWQLASRSLKSQGRIPHALRLELCERHVKQLQVNEIPMRQAMRLYFKGLERRMQSALNDAWPNVIAQLPEGKSAEKRLRIAREKGILPEDLLYNMEREIEYLVVAGGGFIEDAIHQAVAATLRRVGADRVGFPAAELEEILRKRVFKFSDLVARASQEEIRSLLAQGAAEGWGISQMSAAINRICNGWETFRSERIARTEINGSANQGNQVGYERSGVVERKAWLTYVDERTRTFANGSRFDHELMNNKEIGVRELFDVQGDLIEYPGDQQGDPANIINCRCTTVPVIG